MQPAGWSDPGRFSRSCSPGLDFVRPPKSARSVEAVRHTCIQLTEPEATLSLLEASSSGGTDSAASNACCDWVPAVASRLSRESGAGSTCDFCKAASNALGGRHNRPKELCKPRSMQIQTTACAVRSCDHTDTCWHYSARDNEVLKVKEGTAWVLAVVTEGKMP